MGELRSAARSATPTRSRARAHLRREPQQVCDVGLRCRRRLALRLRLSLGDVQPSERLAGSVDRHRSCVGLGFRLGAQLRGRSGIDLERHERLLRREGLHRPGLRWRAAQRRWDGAQRRRRERQFVHRHRLQRRRRAIRVVGAAAREVHKTVVCARGTGGG